MSNWSWLVVGLSVAALGCGGSPSTDAGVGGGGGSTGGGGATGGGSAGGGTGGGSSGGGTGGGGGTLDSGTLDAGPPFDAGVTDAGPIDAGAGDAGLLDAGVADAGFDAGVGPDAGATDAGGSADAGVTGDAGAPDAGVTDAGVPFDAGTDAGAPFDAGPVDAGFTMLTLSTTGTGPGTIGGPGFTCGPTCTPVFPTNTAVTVVASAGVNSTFTGWSGACSGVDASCSLVMSTHRSAVANFEGPQTLTVSNVGLTGAQGDVDSVPAGIGCGSTCSTTFPWGTTVQLAATPDAGAWFSQWGGSCSGAGGCTLVMNQPHAVVATFVPPANYLFVTSIPVVPGNLGGVDGGDALCQALALDAGLPGTFIALLPSPTDTVLQRLGTARGWVRPDRRPVMDLITDSIGGQNKLLYNPVLTEKRTLVNLGDYIVTGTAPSGSAHANTCNGWTSDAGQAHLASPSSNVGSQWLGMNNGYDFACTQPTRVYCAGIDLSTPLTVVPPTPSRLIFTSQNVLTPGSGLSGGDAVCQAEATDAGLPGSYKALLATQAASAGSRFDGGGPPWVRVDGVAITNNAATLLSGGAGFLPLAFVTTTAWGQYTVAGYGIATGATGPGVAGSIEECNAWTNSSAGMTLRYGSPAYFQSGAFFSWTTSDCSWGGARLYCLQE